MGVSALVDLWLPVHLDGTHFKLYTTSLESTEKGDKTLFISFLIVYKRQIGLLFPKVHAGVFIA